MKKNGLEHLLVVVLFILVLVVFSFAERDTRKLEHLYKTATLIQQKTPAATVQLPPPPDQKAQP